MGLEYLFIRNYSATRAPPMAKKIQENINLSFLNQQIVICPHVQATKVLPCAHMPDRLELRWTLHGRDWLWAGGTLIEVGRSWHQAWIIPMAPMSLQAECLLINPASGLLRPPSANMPSVHNNAGPWCWCLYFIPLQLLCVLSLTRPVPPATKWLDHLFNILLICYSSQKWVLKTPLAFFSLD